MADFWDSALNTLKTLAPSIATALGGPIAGMAVTAIEKVFGLEPTGDQTTAMLAINGATAEQILALKKADQEFAVQMRNLDIDLEKISAGDRDSARRREVDAHDSWTPRLLASLIVAAYISVQWYILGHVIEQGMREIVLRSMGTIDGALMLCLSYYFGSMNKAAK
jgi:hypothetical protein